jgi:dihydropyrimidine dehydrogenase (NAD+) subunit PreT
MRTTQLIGYSEALIEAQRCLGCYEPPCSQACPANVNIPGFIRRLAEENLAGAGELLYSSCPLATTCGLACPTLDLCEGACTLIKMGQTAVRIGSLQTYVASQYLQPEEIGLLPSPSKIAVIGGGPSGLGCAVQLRRLGHEVEIFDRGTLLGGLVDRVIPHHRLPHELIDFDLDRIINSGVAINLVQDIDQQRIQEMLDAYDAIFVGTGLSNSRTLNVPGVECEGVHSALHYLDSARQSEKGNLAAPDLGKQVIVVGGGNVALDAAVMAMKLGAKRVIVLYRRTKEEMPGWESEYIEAATLGVEFRWLSVVQEIASLEGKLQSVFVETMKLTDTGVDGRRKVVPDTETPAYELKCDSVVLALGQVIDPALLTHLDLAITGEGTVMIDKATYQTKNPRVFSAGEVVSGGATVVYSMNQGMAAGRAMHAWLQGEKV